MNKQRKVLITITYNEMGVIIDTKTVELGSSAQPEPCEDTISRQAAIEALTTYIYNVCRGINKQMSIDRCEVAAKSVIGELPTVQPNTSELINRIRSEINSKNRNSADYFIVDRIERIVNEWENEHSTDSN